MPIPGTRKVERLSENIGAAAIELSTDDLSEIAAALATTAVQGERYPEEFMKLSGR